VGAADHDLRARVHRAADDPVHPIELLLVDDRPEIDLLPVRIAESQSAGLLGQQLDVVGGHAAMDDVPAGREADLALELERRERPGRGRRLEVCVVEHDECVVAPQLEADTLEQLAGERPDATPCRGRARERHPVDVRVRDDRLADIGATEDDVEQPVGQAGFAEDGFEDRSPADGRLGIRFEDHGVAEGQRRRDDPHPEHGR
jgi:hypothetical protein